MNRRNIYTLAIFALVIGVLGASFAYLKDIQQSSANTRIQLSSFNIALSDMTTVTLNNTYPMSDLDGLQNGTTTFSIQNNGAMVAKYKVSLVDGQTPSTMRNTDARYQLKRTKGSNAQENLGITNLSDTGRLDEGQIGVGETISYELIMWIDHDANPNGQTFTKYISIEGMQIASLDTSGANFPELVDNMIPVYYEATNDTTGVWKKADIKNLDDDYQWFDYDQQMWANAVTVKESGTQTRDYYLAAANGTTISMDDITTMWVWIPRYKYIIFNGKNGTAEEQMINVTFEHGKETTGTVMCHDDILTADDSDHSEICTDTTNNGIVNFKSTYTHPAFCFGTKNNDGTCNGEELTGFWMAKFEMSTDDNDCNTTANETNCNKTGLNILVKPDVYSLRYETVSTMFANIRRMETYGNIHGFKQNENATTWLDASSNLTGEIAGDNNQIDTHMIKNMEWGAVAYLSQSKYGKQGNSLYTGDYKEVYSNNNSNFKTGYYNQSILYNNLTTNGIGQGYKGAGASTTGTMYGIYDMSGGALEYVMANAGSISAAGTMNAVEKYIEHYSYYLTDATQDSIFRSKLGDAIKENYNLECNNSWYCDKFFMPYGSNSWLLRGESAGTSISIIGIYALKSYNGASYDYRSSRPVLTIIRSMPWLKNNNS